MKTTRWLIPTAALLFFPSFLRAASDPLRSVAVELADGLSHHKNAKIAVLAIPHHDAHLSDGPLLVSERLTNLLVKDRRLAVLDRSHIIQMLEELHLSETGLIDPKDAKKIGQVLGADIIVTGTLIDFSDGTTEVNVRGLTSQTGRIIAASRTIINRSWEDRPVLGW